MDNITAAILLALSVFLTLSSIRFYRKSRNKSTLILPVLFGALTLVIALFLVLQMLGFQG